MDTTKIRFLLERYYSGEISPKEYESLLEAFRSCEFLPDDLEAERRMLLAIEDCQPSMPENLKERLGEAIDKKTLRPKLFRKILLYSSAAAVLLFCITIVFHYSETATLQSETTYDGVASKATTPQPIYIAQNTATDNTTATSAVDGTSKELEAPHMIVVAPSKESPARRKKTSKRVKQPVDQEMTDEELERAARMIDEALINALSGLKGTQNNMNESFENIKINRITI